MKRFVLGFLCALSLSIAPACGGDDDGGDTGDGAGADAAAFDADAFCTDFSGTCGFADWFGDQAGCVAAVSAFDATRQACVVEHLGFAAGTDEGSADREMHCGHASGEAPCD
jgi:hypothetical protein